MAESFQLLSSMSPKLKTSSTRKTAKKGNTVLALKKHFRRSSVYDKVSPTIGNEDLIVIDGSTDSSKTTFNGKGIKELQKNSIIVLSSDSSCNENKSKMSGIKIPQRTEAATEINGRSLLSRSKVNQIQHWLENVETESSNKIFSEVSLIAEDDVQQEKAFSSANKETHKSVKTKSVGEYNRKQENHVKQIVEDNRSNKSVSIIDDSFDVELNESLNTRLKKHIPFKNIKNSNTEKEESNLKAENSNTFKRDIPLSEHDDSIIILDRSHSLKNKKQSSLDGVLKVGDGNCSKITDVKTKEFVKNNNVPVNNCDDIHHEKVEIDNEEVDLESVLDSLYGDTWRKNKEDVLPQSEPRNKLKSSHNLRNICSEKKPNLSNLWKQLNNNYESELPNGKFKVSIDNPWRSNLRDLCDSDSDSGCEKQPFINIRKKLTFNIDDDIDKRLSESKNSEIVSEYFTPNKQYLGSTPPKNQENEENFSDLSDSYLGESLEERIRRNINKTRDGSKVENHREIVLKDKTDDLNKNTESKNRKSSSTSNSDISGSRGPARTRKKAQFINSDSISDRTDNISLSSDEEWDKEITRIIEEKRKDKRVVSTYTFLESLSANIPISKCDISARIFRNNYKQYKDMLTTKLFKIYNEAVFNNSLPQDTLLEWSDRMRGTAGYCYCKKITRRTGTIERKARIVLSTKVLDSPDRLRDTLIHEMCHAATWILNQVSDGHGAFWKSWACKAMRTFPELPPIRRCHDYVINTKYTYKCTGCGYSIGRHTKSLDIERKRCGYCYGKFETLINKVTKNGQTKTVPVTPRKEANGFALFVKENYAIYKNPQRKHGEVMKMLGQKFSEMKLKQIENV